LKKQSGKVEKEEDYDRKKENVWYGEYTEIVEQEFLNYVTKAEYSVCHFYHKDFERCKIIDKHLQVIAPEHKECKFLKLDAEKSPFFVNKLAVQVLPTICLFKKGVLIDKIVGFEEFGGKDDFKTIEMTRRLVKSGVLKPKNRAEKGIKIEIIEKKREEVDDKSVKELAKHLTQDLNCSKIEHLELTLKECYKITDKGVKELATHVGTKLTALKHLELSFVNSPFFSGKITDQGVNELAFQIGSNLKALQHLDLNFFDCQQITDQGLKELASQIGPNLKNLQHLDLIFSSTNITDQGRDFGRNCLKHVSDFKLH